MKGYIPITIYGHGDHLGHVTSIILINIISMYLNAYKLNFVIMAKWFLRNASFNFQM